jgi:hypothetical protein
LHPDHWAGYAAQLQRWLRPGGTLLLLAMQCLRDGAAHGRIEGPPYHMDINTVRALLPSDVWRWSAPPYPRVAHPVGWYELAIVLQRIRRARCAGRDAPRRTDGGVARRSPGSRDRRRARQAARRPLAGGGRGGALHRGARRTR